MFAAETQKAAKLIVQSLYQAILSEYTDFKIGLILDGGGTFRTFFYFSKVSLIQKQQFASIVTIINKT